MLEDLVETEYFELELPLTAAEVSNIFHYHRGQDKYWKMSNKPLRVLQEGKIVAEYSSWSDIQRHSTVKNVIAKNSSGYPWFPTLLMHRNGLFKLYSKKFEVTEKGTIPVVGFVDTPSAQKETTAVKIGNIGEMAIEKFYGATRSDDWYDSEKDGMIGELTYELKTIQLNQREQGFWIDESQWKKLDGVDLLFFIKVPHKETDLAVAYLCSNHKTCYNHVYNNKGNKLRNYPLTNCLRQFIMDPEQSKKIYDNSKDISTWRK